MFYYDLRLGSIALLLIALRAAAIVATSDSVDVHVKKRVKLPVRASSWAEK